MPNKPKRHAVAIPATWEIARRAGRPPRADDLWPSLCGIEARIDHFSAEVEQVTCFECRDLLEDRLASKVAYRLKRAHPNGR